ncbi:hypothetical protein AEAC466_14525 [Asticcacaulis sp. AC466]|uniref:hypothetical protein n=1 Tax=Asticcacaulis sp. AC466 TaxID=1282362 RepID=UPI0003C40F0E|nr:hypothetical protein [Asticcacaulis sp. AC466]ESQ83075.1 hypothetical protein AEAC466_14525 [Asticcacaulis sp. AC466]
MRFKTLAAAVLAGTVVAGAAWAWGSSGHRMIGELAIKALPDYMPAFLRTPQAVADVGEYAREPDRWRGAGKVHDNDRDIAHFIDLDDDGNTLAGVSLDNLPANRSDYEAAVRAKGVEPYKAGYLPYATVDAYQQVVKDMAYWRVLTYLEPLEKDRTKKAWYRADRLRREQLMLRDIGILGHYVGDTTNPLHLSIHYNGWGNFPNPNGFTMEKIHSPIEGVFVSRNIKEGDVKAAMAAYLPCTAPIMTCVTARYKASFSQVVPLYQLEKAGGFKDGDPRGQAFITTRLAQGAGDLRDSLIDAWRDSKTMQVGYKIGTYDDFVSGKVTDPWEVLYGDD